MRPPRDVLVVELLGGFGDLLLVLPALPALAASWPDASLSVLTFTPGDALLRTDPSVARVVRVDDHSEGAPRAAVERELAARSYDLVVTTTRYDGIGELCASAAPHAVVDLWQRPPADERVDRRFLRLLRDAGAIDARLVDTPLRVHLGPEEHAAGDATVAGLVPPGSTPVVLVPDAGMPVKRWPAERWAELTAALSAAGATVLLAGRDAPPTPGAVPLPPGDLRVLGAQLAAVGRRGGVVVGGDTGPVRLATAVGARAVGLYGPTVAGRYGLDPARATSLQGLPECPVRLPTAFPEQECWWSGRCPLSDGGEPACLADLGTGEVIAAVREQLGVRP